METIKHYTQVCVVGGGLSGLCAAVAAARHGARALLMHDRPMPGGNASSEIRMWVCGAHGSNMRETGIIEELLLENQYLNPDKSYAIWDSVTYGLARETPGLVTLMNCACMTGEAEGGELKSITGYQSTTQRFHQVFADIFIDASGDSVLAPITGARTRMGREGRREHGESHAPETGDNKTMGMSCLIQAVKTDTPNEFIAPKWARRVTRADLEPYRVPNLDAMMENFWYLELGGDRDTIKDTEILRDELVAEALGLWDYIKNAPENKEKHALWHLDWIGLLPGKRESRRYVGEYTLTQSDIEAGGRFDDIIAYGGWSMDNHNPGGMRATDAPPTVYHPAPSPFGIPYMCLCVKDIRNLMCAGRNISVTHMALSATRVMATCATIGQAAGIAAALAAERNTTPADIGRGAISDVQALLMWDDCFLPYLRRQITPVTRRASITVGGAPSPALANGFDRPINGEDNGARAALGESVEMRFEDYENISGIRLVLDSDLDRETLPEAKLGLTRNMPCNRFPGMPASCVPKTLAKAYHVDALTEAGWERAFEGETHQRLTYARFSARAKALRVVFDSTWGAQDAHLFAIDAF